MPEQGDNGFIWISFVLAIALAGLFVKYDARPARADVEKQQIRDKEREDKLLADNTSSTSLMKEQSAILGQSVTIAETGLELAKKTDARLESNQKEMLARLTEVEKKIDALVGSGGNSRTQRTS